MIEAALEYLISILVATTFLATITTELGISDSLTGILSSILSLGCVFQLLSLFFRRRSEKRFVIILSIWNQCLFMLLYVIPLFSGNKTLKIVIFVITIILAYLFYNIAHPKKINWLMSLVEDGKRGTFTANKEMLSLAIGILFNFCMGYIVDYYKDSGSVRTAFIICAVTIFVLMVLHTVTLLIAVEKPLPSEQTSEKTNVLKDMFAVLNDKNVQRVAILFVLWNMAQYVSTPFYGTYQIKELGFSLKFVSMITMLYSIVRILFSKVFGRYADKTSFASMIQICFLVAGGGFFINMFTVPSNGKLFYTAYYICYATAMAGINSSLINLVFDYVSVEKRADSLAICLAGSGVVGFITTLLASSLVTLIQKEGNSFMGISHIYAQQVVSEIALIFTIACVLYVKFVMKKVK